MLTPENFALVIGTFLIAGSLKGLLGMGLPTVSVALLSTLLGHKEAMALILVPSLLTNIWQGFFGGHLRELWRKLWGLLIATGVFTVIGTAYLAEANPLFLSGLFGVVLSLYAGYAIFTPQIPPPPPRHEGWLSPIMGAMGGFMSGYMGSFIIPGLLYIQALGLKREQLVQSMGLAFAIITVGMGAGMAHHAILTDDLIILSASALPPVLLGLFIGQRYRHRLPEAIFRKIFFFALFVLGLYTCYRAMTVSL